MEEDGSLQGPSAYPQQFDRGGQRGGLTDRTSWGDGEDETKCDGDLSTFLLLSNLRKGGGGDRVAE